MDEDNSGSIYLDKNNTTRIKFNADAKKLATAKTITFFGDVTGSLSFDGSSDVEAELTVEDNSHTHYIENITDLEDTLASKANKTQGIYYIEGSGDEDGTAGSTWVGSHDDITEYYNGLMIAYKIGVAGASGGTTLNINKLGVVAVKRNGSTTVTTQYAVGSILFLTYDEETWQITDYDTNTDTKVSQIHTDTSGSYPLLFKSTSGTSSTTTTAASARYSNKIYANPSTGLIRATTFSGSLTGNATTATKWKSVVPFSILGVANDANVVSIDGNETSAKLAIPTEISNFTSVESDTFIVKEKVTLQYNEENQCLEFIFA
jgi:hypothetical protein